MTTATLDLRAYAQTNIDALEMQIESLRPYAVIPEPPLEPTPEIPAPPGAYTEGEARAFLDKIGLAEVRDIHRATRQFQEAFALGDALAVDGDFGPKTTAAAEVCKAAGHRISRFFKMGEFACHGPASDPNCARVRVQRRLLFAADATREKFYTGQHVVNGKPLVGLTVLSGYRCTEHNRRIGGASNSQHLTGNAFDPEVQWIALADFLAVDIPQATGIGYGSTGKVKHIDARAGSRVQFKD